MTTSNLDYGTRQIGDMAPFNLWQSSTRKIRNPSPEEVAWLRKTYNITIFQIQPPFLVLSAQNPPNPAPETIGRIPVIFLNPEVPSHMIRIFNPNLAACANAAYFADYRPHIGIPDPVPNARPIPFMSPSEKEIEDIRLGLINSGAVFKAITFCWPRILVELVSNDGDEYGANSLPKMVGGWITAYHLSEKDYFEGMSIGEGRVYESLRIIERDLDSDQGLAYERQVVYQVFDTKGGVTYFRKGVCATESTRQTNGNFKYILFGGWVGSSFLECSVSVVISYLDKHYSCAM